MENNLKNVKVLRPTIQPHDYRPALQGALSWLGKRYLLAEPMNRRGDGRKPYVGESSRA
jgi:hypothetical protein